MLESLIQNVGKEVEKQPGGSGKGGSTRGVAGMEGVLSQPEAIMKLPYPIWSYLYDVCVPLTEISGLDRGLMSFFAPLLKHWLAYFDIDQFYFVPYNRIHTLPLVEKVRMISEATGYHLDDYWVKQLGKLEYIQEQEIEADGRKLKGYSSAGTDSRGSQDGELISGGGQLR